MLCERASDGLQSTCLQAIFWLEYGKIPMHARRLFVGLSLSDALRKRLRQETVMWEGLPLFPIHPNNWHVTLLFLGFVPEIEIPLMSERLDQSVADLPAFELVFTAICLAPDVEHPSMVWLAGEPHDTARQLRQNIEHALGYRAPEHKSFRPHVTLARVRRARFRALVPRPTIEKSVRLVEPIEAVTLFESVLDEGKRIYQPLLTVPLAG